MITDHDGVAIRLVVNGETVLARVPSRLSLIDFLRDRLGLTGGHVGCEHGACGACSVALDGKVIRGCLIFAIQADGHRIETIEGATKSGRIRDLQDAFFERAALQCGFCTPGMLLNAGELLEQNSAPSRTEIRTHLAGNYCRCTGYEAIVDAVSNTAEARRRKAAS